MKISRREFLRAVTGMAGAIGLEASGLLKLQEAFAAPGAPSVIWLQGAGCTGCSVSFLNSIYYASADEVLLNNINLEYHPNVVPGAGDFAISATDVSRPSSGELMDINSEWLENGQDLYFDLNADGIVNFVDFAQLSERGYILVVEGAIPFGSNCSFCEIASNLTMVDAMNKFGSAASEIIALGSCASFGGIPAGNPNPTEALSVQQSLARLGIQKPLINIPGCPAHPDWLVGTIVSILTTGSIPTLDSQKRPTAFFGSTVHSTCPNLSLYNSTYARNVSHSQDMSCLSCHSRNDSHVPNPRSLGSTGCLYALGCKGRQTYADCSTRKWNSPSKEQAGVNWCVQAGSPCLGCTEPGFPDSMSPFQTLNGNGADDD
jgi:hydrogenase small subunit